LLKRSAQVNGLSGLCITKLDVLDGLKELLLCVGYELDGQQIDILPMGADEIARCKPIYETIPGWSVSTVGVTEYAKLPPEAQALFESYFCDHRRSHPHGVDQPLIVTTPFCYATLLPHNAAIFLKDIHHVD
jgi:adenylosuccinate synthase